MPDCRQGDCTELTWDHTEDHRLAPFVAWADEQFERVAAGPDGALPGPDAELPDDTYGPVAWAAVIGLYRRQGLPVGPAHDFAGM